MINMKPSNLNRATLISIGEQYANAIGINKLYDNKDEAYSHLVEIIKLLGGRPFTMPYFQMLLEDVYLDIARPDFFILYAPPLNELGPISGRNHLLRGLGHILMHYTGQDTDAKIPFQYTSDTEPLILEARVFSEGASVGSQLLKTEYAKCSDPTVLAGIFAVSEQTIINRLCDLNLANGATR